MDAPNVRQNPVYITVKCTVKDCAWDGLEDCSSVFGEREAKTHVRHTHHAVSMVETRTLYWEE